MMDDLYLNNCLATTSRRFRLTIVWNRKSVETRYFSTKKDLDNYTKQKVFGPDTHLSAFNQYLQMDEKLGEINRYFWG